MRAMQLQTRPTGRFVTSTCVPGVVLQRSARLCGQHRQSQQSACHLQRNVCVSRKLLSTTARAAAPADAPRWGGSSDTLGMVTISSQRAHAASFRSDQGTKMALSQIGLVGLAVMGQVGWVLSEQMVQTWACANARASRRTCPSTSPRRASLFRFSTDRMRRPRQQWPVHRKKVQGGLPRAFAGCPRSGALLTLITCIAGLSDRLRGYKDVKDFVESLEKPRCRSSSSSNSRGSSRAPWHAHQWSSDSMRVYIVAYSYGHLCALYSRCTAAAAAATSKSGRSQASYRQHNTACRAVMPCLCHARLP
jgi:hypothetical protein